MKKAVLLTTLLLSIFIRFKSNAQSFVVDITTSTVNVIQGTNLTLTVNGLPSGGFNSSIQMSMTNKCFNTTDVVFTPSIMNPPYVGQIQINNTNQYIAGTYKLVVKGVNGTITSYDSVDVVIQSNLTEQWFHYNLAKFGFMGSYFVNDLETDSKNNYWISVWSYGLGGICKYNGTTVESWVDGKYNVYDMCGVLISSVSDNLFQIGHKGPYALEIDSLDNVWFYDTRITAFKPGTGVIFQSPAHPLINSSIVQMKMKAKSFLNKQFYLTGDNGLYYFNGTNFIDYNVGNSLIPSNNCNDLDIDATGAVWVSTNAGLGKFFNNFWSVYNTSNSTIVSNDLRAVKVAQGGGILISTNAPQSLSKITGTTFSVVANNICLYDLHYDSKGNIWGISFPNPYKGITKISPALSVTNWNQGVLKYINYTSNPYDLISLQVDKFDTLMVGSGNVNLLRGDLLVQTSWKMFNSTSIEEYNSMRNSNSTFVYPNPGSSSISFKDIPIGNYIISIFNLFGNLIYSNNISEKEAVNVSNLNSGIYFIELEKGQQTFRTKFIKN